MVRGAKRLALGQLAVAEPVRRSGDRGAIIEASRTTAADKRGGIEGSRAASIDLPAAGGPTVSELKPSVA